MYTRSFFLITPLFLISFQALTNFPRKIYVYNDSGVSFNCLQQTIDTFSELFPDCSIKTLDAEEVKAGLWSHDAFLFIMPGGRDVPYTQKLNGLGNAIIRRYVESGGNYWGFCAGAYYGGSYIEFDKGGPYQVIGPRQLKFYPGTEIGPAMAPYSYTNNSGARAPTLRLNTNMSGKIHKLHALVNGGGYFENVDQYSNVTILGWYPGLPARAAIIQAQVQRGLAILSGAHLEFNPALMNKTDPFLAPLIPILEKANNNRLKLLKIILNML